MTYHAIKREDRPAWYHIGLDRDGEFCVFVHPDCWDEIMPRITSTATHIMSGDKRPVLPLPEFVHPDQQTWGHGRTVYTTIDVADWRKITFPVPRIVENPTDEVPTWAWAQAETMVALFRQLTFWEGQVDTDRPQLLVISNILVLVDGGGGSFGSILSRAMVAGLRQLSQQDFDRAELAMQSAYRHVRLFHRPRRSEFVAGCNDVGLHLSCHGYAGGLDPDRTFSVQDAESGYDMVGHNVDTIAQQRALLAGLASLVDSVSAKR